MVMSEKEEDSLNKKHLDLCNKLNLDPDKITASWDNFKSLSKNFVLEGDVLHWLGCSIFVVCKCIDTQTLGSSVTRSSRLDLTSLLRHSNLSFAQFFCNISKWVEMAHLPEEFHNRIIHLKDAFGVTYSTFKEYYTIFSKIFLSPNPQELESKQHRNRKQRPITCNTAKVFEFIWNLFITLKCDETQYNMELIKSYHLLYACIDLAFKNAFMAYREDLLNPEFEMLPSDWGRPHFVMPSEPPCLIGYLCKCSSMLTDAMHMKMYTLKEMILGFIKNNTLAADPINLTGLFSTEVFVLNFKNIVNAYEVQLLKKDFDERIFLVENRRQLLEQQSNIGVRVSLFCDSGENGILESPIRREVLMARNGEMQVTKREFVGNRGTDITASIDRISSQKATRLHNMLIDRSTSPSKTLIKLFESCGDKPSAKVEYILKTMGNKFTTAYVSDNPNSEEEGKKQLQIGITLFYKFIENVLQNEKKLHDDISGLLDKEVFYHCMFACCLEIVLFSYNSSKKFPWLLDILNIEPFQFVKVIELIVRLKDQLSREVIKHLNKIEETVIESLAWKSNSKIWSAIYLSENVPKFEETALPGHILYIQQSTNTNDQNEISDASMMQISATESFQSPIKQTTSNMQLQPVIQAGQSVLQKNIHLNKNGSDKLTSVIDSEQPAQQKKKVDEVGHVVSKKTGGLFIIFRKFYNLAGMRMEHLCTKLGLTNTELKQKIWTVFEESIRNTDLIKDRHLDQLLMCAVYIICKVSGGSLKFQDIMKFYREQPQSTSDVYRDVLLFREKIESDGRVTPAERSDLIHFYNSVYVEVMRKFAIKFRTSVHKSDLLLSPLPAIKRDLVSPSVQVLGNVFVKPLESPSNASGTSFNYFFSRSPSKDLKDINKLVNTNVLTGKRLLIEDDTEIPSSKRISNRKLQSLVEERRIQNTE